MKTLFRTVLDGMQDNNEINDAQFLDWDMAQDAINFYGKEFDLESIDENELQATYDALNKIIDRIARQTPPFRAGKDSADGE